MIDMAVLVVDYSSCVSDIHPICIEFAFLIITLYVEFSCAFSIPYSISYLC